MRIIIIFCFFPLHFNDLKNQIFKVKIHREDNIYISTYKYQTIGSYFLGLIFLNSDEFRPIFDSDQFSCQTNFLHPPPKVFTHLRTWPWTELFRVFTANLRRDLVTKTELNTMADNCMTRHAGTSPTIP